jgi:hypothetical protein
VQKRKRNAKLRKRKCGGRGLLWAVSNNYLPNFHFHFHFHSFIYLFIYNYWVASRVFFNFNMKINKFFLKI